jgi:hypothetical protein
MSMTGTWPLAHFAHTAPAGIPQGETCQNETEQ